MQRLFTSIIFILLTATACAPFQAHKHAGTQGADSASILFAQGNFERAGEAYAKLASQHPNKQDHYYLMAADAWLQADSYDKAQDTLDKVHQHKLDEADNTRYSFILASLAMHHDDAQKARELLHDNVTKNLPEELAKRYWQLKRTIAVKLEDHWLAATAAVQLADYLHDEDDKASNERFILKQLSKMGEDALTAKLLELAIDDPMLPWVDKALDRSSGQHYSGNLDLAHRINPTDTSSVDLEKLRNIALILPLTGAGSAAAKPVQQGFLSAYFHQQKALDIPFHIRFYDSQSTPQGALAAYDKAVQEGADKIIGPLLHTTVAAVLDHLDAGHPPIITLNQPQKPLSTDEKTWQFALQPEEEGAQGAQYLLQKGLKHAIILHDGSAYATRVMRTFTQTLKQHDGSIINAIKLDPNQANYTGQLGSLHLTGNEASNAAIYLIMQGQQARLLMPQIRLEKSQLPVFATSRIYSGYQDIFADSDLDGITYSDSPWLYQSRPGLPSQHTTTKLKSSKGSAARLFAFGMDAWLLTIHSDQLAARPDDFLAGASGDLTIRDDGYITRILAWVTFAHGRPAMEGDALNMDKLIITP